MLLLLLSVLLSNEVPMLLLLLLSVKEREDVEEAAGETSSPGRCKEDSVTDCKSRSNDSVK